uniref:Uncharacterized protein n=1 Tax=Sexangularia sp. CB-2014 TaxID=1486929 RepID=A0A7S1VKV9_9EUKA|mmetsp:Transcript_5561/g.18052  ORF Transcript_5561/g.18052 Transcript_5561/m.18052 type:complete len:276 (+) Transcript_5561:130-957(+)
MLVLLPLLSLAFCSSVTPLRPQEVHLRSGEPALVFVGSARFASPATGSTALFSASLSTSTVASSALGLSSPPSYSLIPIVTASSSTVAQSVHHVQLTWATATTIDSLPPLPTTTTSPSWRVTTAPTLLDFPQHVVPLTHLPVEAIFNLTLAAPTSLLGTPVQLELFIVRATPTDSTTAPATGHSTRPGSGGGDHEPASSPSRHGDDKPLPRHPSASSSSSSGGASLAILISTIAACFLCLGLGFLYVRSRRASAASQYAVDMQSYTSSGIPSIFK